mmetsp:Transcript_5052/g.14969  ORF Transcript_5052/g.14969 Transcript_5052/m.14969 type:complete len:260 (-) Transcript_5052:29-808(-)
MQRSAALCLLFYLSDALNKLPRRAALGSGAALLFHRPSPAAAAAEWRCEALQDKSWTVSKRQESSVRIRPETMLVAADEKTDRELKLLKVPLGRAAAASFAPEDQLDLAKFFSSRQDAEALGPKRIADVMGRSLALQAKNPASPLQGVALDASKAAVSQRGGRRYVGYDYVADACRRIDENGECLRRAKRLVSASVSVSLESQARTLEEQRRMDEGEMEQRYIDTLWIMTASAPQKGSDEGTQAALRRAADSFAILVND